jgi:hypothetical protein
MAVVIPKEGKLAALGRLVEDQNYSLRLFKNNFTPDVNSVLADFTIANFSGYASLAAGWGARSLDGGGLAQCFSVIADFLHDGGATANDVYGWYIQDDTAAKVLAANRLAAPPVVMDSVGDLIQLTFRAVLSQV